jgi:hypothetical protein
MDCAFNGESGYEIIVHKVTSQNLRRCLRSFCPEINESNNQRVGAVVHACCCCQGCLVIIDSACMKYGKLHMICHVKTSLSQTLGARSTASEAAQKVNAHTSSSASRHSPRTS